MMAGSVMIALILILRAAALRRLPKWLFRWLWIIAAIRLILPWSLTFTVELPAAPREVMPYDAVQVPIPMDGVMPAPAFTAEMLVQLLLPAGALAAAAFFLFAYARLRRIAHHAKPRILCGETVRVGRGYPSPFSCGIVRPVIFLPAEMLTLPGDQLACILAHERCYMKRGDQLVKWLIVAAVCLHWWNPAVWLMLRYANRDMELACDEAVLRRSGRAEYALCLIAAEEVRSAAPINAFGAPAMEERIECIMKTKHLTVCGFVCAALLLAAMTSFFIKVDAVTVPAEADTAAVTEQSPEPTVEAETEKDDCEETTVVVIEGEQYEEEGMVIDEDPIWEEGMVIAEKQFLMESISLIHPLTGDYTVTQGFTDAHPAVDLVAPLGSDVLAAADGIVMKAEYTADLGNVIYIDHGSDIVTVYAHCDTLAVSVDDSVTAGEVIATVGQTGNATGPHLHFATMSGGGYFLAESLFDPADFPKRPF
ncbi:MAG: hypothetical protein E7632_09055 [Ruminococcaceae bacterium]|nr:hypothetical protein [Oscillospiraceae bacterium]